jgi:hypothetical protein
MKHGKNTDKNPFFVFSVFVSVSSVASYCNQASVCHDTLPCTGLGRFEVFFSTA